MPFLGTLYKWEDYKPLFDPEKKEQTLFPLKKIYDLCLEERGNWVEFYNKMARVSSDEKVSSYREIARCIAKIHQWQEATGSLKERNRDRIIYTIPNSDIIISVDTQHGEFEVHKNKKGSNHLGSVSFDGENFKDKKQGRTLEI